VEDMVNTLVFDFDGTIADSLELELMYIWNSRGIQF